MEAAAYVHVHTFEIYSLFELNGPNKVLFVFLSPQRWWRTSTAATMTCRVSNISCTSARVRIIIIISIIIIIIIIIIVI